MISNRLKFFDFYSLSVRHISASPRLQNDTFRDIDKVIPKNVIKNFDNGKLQVKNGVVYDSKPFKLELKRGKIYRWCLCGHSKSQPLCDGTHKIEGLEIKLKPILFEVSETKEYWLCNCKQTKHRPFCDGTHIPILEEEIRKHKERLLKKSEAQGTNVDETSENDKEENL